MKKNTLSEHKFMAGISPCAGGTRQPCLAAQRYVRSTDGTCTSSFHVNTYKNTHMDIYAYRAPITRLINNLQNSFRKQKKNRLKTLRRNSGVPALGTVCILACGRAPAAPGTLWVLAGMQATPAHPAALHPKSGGQGGGGPAARAL